MLAGSEKAASTLAVFHQPLPAQIVSELGMDHHRVAVQGAFHVAHLRQRIEVDLDCRGGVFGECPVPGDNHGHRFALPARDVTGKGWLFRRTHGRQDG